MDISDSELRTQSLKRKRLLCSYPPQFEHFGCDCFVVVRNYANCIVEKLISPTGFEI